jgi:hypothetical protein
MMDMEMLKLMKEARHIYIYGAGSRGQNFLPVCETYRLPEEIDIVVTDNANERYLGQHAVWAFSDIRMEKDDVIFVAMGESYWQEILEKVSDRYDGKGIKVEFLTEKVIDDLRKEALTDSLKKAGIDTRLLPRALYAEIYGEQGLEAVGSIEKKMWELATEESARYANRHMTKAQIFHYLGEYHIWLMTQIDHSDDSVENICMEFGVNTGYTINRFADHCNNHFYGFDSFEGLPEDWIKGFEKSTFKQDKLPKVRRNVTLVQGWFDQSLPVFICEHDLEEEKIRFIHIDCDLYSSTKTVFGFLGKYIQKGTIIAFDEYFNFPGWENHEFKAFQEWVSENDMEYEYIAFVENSAQAAVRIL